jgi:hypothetical protein
MAGSILMKTLSIVFLLAYTTVSNVPLACLYVLVALVANWFLEKKLCGPTDGSSWLRAAHSLIFPLAPRAPGRRAALGAALQLAVGNITATTLGALIGLQSENTGSQFITTSMMKAIAAMSLLLMIHVTIPYAAIVVWQASSTPEEDDIEEGDVESTDSALLISNHHEDQEMKQFKNLAWLLLLPTTLAIILASPYLLLVQFNTCASLPSDYDSHIICSNNSSLVVGTVCNLTCSPLHLSTSSLETTCTWRGNWTVTDFSCRPQSAALDIGHIDPKVWPVVGNKSHLSYPQVRFDHSMAGYLDGGLYFCGGVGLKLGDEASPSCQSLRPPQSVWKEESPLRQVRSLAYNFCLSGR